MEIEVSREDAGNYVETGTWSFIQFEQWFQRFYPDLSTEDCISTFTACRSKYYYTKYLDKFISNDV